MIFLYELLRELSVSVVRQAHYVLSPSKDAVQSPSFSSPLTVIGRGYPQNNSNQSVG